MTTDATLVVRIVANLVQNALIHGGGEAAVDVGLVGNDATIRVVDHGPGVAPEDRETIFRPFQRRGDVRVGLGVGLGLAIARGFTTALGGTLVADDTPGGGCTMVLTLPLVPRAGHRRRRRRSPMTKILLIDDDRPFTRALSIGLGAHGFEVVGAYDGTQGIVEASRAHPDVILLDLGLPGHTGMEVLEAVRAWTDVPVIVLSARHQSAAKVAALDAGADDYITKPFGIEELLARIRAALRRATHRPDHAVVTAGNLRIDLAAGASSADGAAGPPHPQGVGRRRDARAPAGAPGDPARPADPDLGCRIRGRERVPAHRAAADPHASSRTIRRRRAISSPNPASATASRPDRRRTPRSGRTGIVPITS